MKCQATFKKQCQYPKCDCDRPAVIDTTKRLAELEEKLSGGYVGGMTEYWQRQKNFLLSNPCVKGMTKDTCPHNPRLGCDCGAHLPEKK